jgi:hypothetical protein
MDVVDARANLVGVTIVLESVEKLHVTLRCLDGNDISIKTLDRWEDVIEIGVAEVRVSLQCVRYTSSGKLEGINSPFQVCIPVSTTER